MPRRHRNNWGEAFWNSYNSARERKMEYAAWAQDQRDREDADRVIKGMTGSLEEKAGPRLEVQRSIQELDDKHVAEQMDLDAKYKSKEISDEDWKAETGRLTQSYGVQKTPLLNQWSREHEGVITWMMDQATELGRRGGANPYLLEHAKLWGTLANSQAAALGGAAEKTLANTEAMLGDQAQQADMAAREEDVRSGNMALEDRRHEGDMEEIEAKDSKKSSSDAGGVKPLSSKDLATYREKSYAAADERLDSEGVKAGDPTRKATRNRYAREHASEIYPDVDLFGKGPQEEQKMVGKAEDEIRQRLNATEAAARMSLDAINSQIEAIGNDPKRLRNVGKGVVKAGQGQEEEKRAEKLKRLEEMKEKYKTILADVKKKSSAKSVEEWDADMNDMDALSRELEEALK